MQMIRLMYGVSMKDRRTSEELRRMAGVEFITTVIKRGRLRWYGHVMRKEESDDELKSEYRLENQERYD